MIAQAPSSWERIEDYAGDFEQIIDAPVYDAAAVIGVEAAWLSGLLLGIKALSIGFGMILKKTK